MSTKDGRQGTFEDDLQRRIFGGSLAEVVRP